MIDPATGYGAPDLSWRDFLTTSGRVDVPTWSELIERWGAEKWLLKHYALSATRLAGTLMSWEESEYIEEIATCQQRWPQLLNAKIDLLIRLRST